MKYDKRQTSVRKMKGQENSEVETYSLSFTREKPEKPGILREFFLPLKILEFSWNFVEIVREIFRILFLNLNSILFNKIISFL